MRTVSMFYHSNKIASKLSLYALGHGAALTGS